jgi:hypothetical protein
VHHARKGSAKLRAGQALRGSSEFHAWGDSNLYLRRHGHQLTLSVEHRAAPAIAAVALHLATDGDAVALMTTARLPADATPAVVATTPAPSRTPEQRIEDQLVAAATPLTAAALRKLCRIRNATLTAALSSLVAAHRVSKGPDGYTIAR